MDITKRMYDEIAEDYLRELNKVNITKQFRRKFAGYVKKGRIADIGCGPGIDSTYFSRRFDVVGIDFSKEMIEIARKKSQKAKFLCKDMRKIKFSQNSLDGAWISQSIHHIPKKDAIKLLIKIKKYLKKDGIIFLSFREGSSEGFTDKSKTSLFSGKKRFVAMYGKNEISQILKNIGYKVIEISRIERKHGGEVFINVFAKNIK